MTPVIGLRAISKRFVKRLDLAEKLAARLGAPIREETVHAVDGVDLAIHRGEVVGLVGESGCGKSTLGRIVAGIHDPSDGQMFYHGKDVAGLRGEELRAFRLAVQMIFQDPFASLNPRKRVVDIICEAPVAHGLIKAGKREDYAAEMLDLVGLDPSFMRRYPHQFSGGQRQRVGIARAIAVKPEFLVCDEAIAALDVSIQAQVINLLMDLRQRLDLTCLFISHDLSVVEHIADRVVIMYLGRVVEAADTQELFSSPAHPYARALLEEVPRLDARKRLFQPIRGEVPSPLDPPTGCHFHPRCERVMPRCSTQRPELRQIGERHVCACHLHDG